MKDDCDFIFRTCGVIASLFFCCLGFGTVVAVIVNINMDNLWMFLAALVGGLGVGIFGIITMYNVYK